MFLFNVTSVDRNENIVLEMTSRNLFVIFIAGYCICFSVVQISIFGKKCVQGLDSDSDDNSLESGYTETISDRFEKDSSECFLSEQAEEEPPSYREVMS